MTERNAEKIMMKTEMQFILGHDANFIPSNAVNQLEMWQEETFSPALMESELKIARGIGKSFVNSWHRYS